MNTQLEKAVAFDDIQALARFGHGHLQETRFLLLRVRNAQAAGRWLSGVEIQSAAEQSSVPDNAVHLALTVDGLHKLGLDHTVINQFSDEFVRGMHADNSRSRRLGDIDASAPSEWRWGGDDCSMPHVLMLLYARTGAIEAFAERLIDSEFHTAFEVQRTLPTDALGPREPFGFVDGLSQPKVDWQRTQRTDTHARFRYSNLLAPGEVVLGYENEYGQYTRRPFVDPATDRHADTLPTAPDVKGLFDFGQNGSFLVLRQLKQNVAGFWHFFDKAAGGDAQARELLAERMVGRHRDGTPLMPAATHDIPGIGAAQTRNRFDFDTDPYGLQCPVSAHVRRSNPRTGDLPPGSESLLNRLARRLGFGRKNPYEDLVASSRYHRLLRRGRTFGGAILDPIDVLNNGDDGLERGLHFLCLCASLRRQFEFVQNAWSVSTTFAGVPAQGDALLGTRKARLDGQATDNSTYADARGPQVCLASLPRFVDVLGGAYFFMPGIRAVRYLGRIACTP